MRARAETYKLICLVWRVFHEMHFYMIERNIKRGTAPNHLSDGRNELCRL
jgi:hypothetical protein